jgi:hypothetical protein
MSAKPLNCAASSRAKVAKLFFALTTAGGNISPPFFATDATWSCRRGCRERDGVTLSCLQSGRTPLSDELHV